MLRWLGILSCALRTEFQPELGVLTFTKIPYSTQKFLSTAATHLAAPFGASQMRRVAVSFLENDDFWRKKEQSVQVGSAEMLRSLPASPAKGWLLCCCHQPWGCHIWGPPVITSRSAKAKGKQHLSRMTRKMMRYNQLWWWFLEFEYNKNVY